MRLFSDMPPLAPQLEKTKDLSRDRPAFRQEIIPKTPSSLGTFGGE
jgi:hypothetical protein